MLVTYFIAPINVNYKFIMKKKKQAKWGRIAHLTA